MFDFKGLIDALMRRARDEQDFGPTATQMMAELPRNETLAALTEIVKALAALNRNPRVGLKERYRAVANFDDKARPLAQLLIAVHRGEETVDGIQPRQAMPSLLACWKELASAYKLCLKQHAQSPSPRFAHDAELITLRAVSYYAEQAKWAYLRYFEAEPRLWRSLNRLYQIADTAGFAQRPIARYPGDAPISVATLYAHAMLLELAEPARRRPEEIWLLDQALSHWVARVPVEKIIRPREQTYAVNLDEPAPPVKLRRNMVGERYRYLSTEPLAQFLAELADAVRGGARPAELATKDEQLAAHIPDLLDDLALVYSREGQSRSRRSERRKHEQAVLALTGLERIHHALGAAGSTAEWENWTQADESASGVGAHYKARYNDQLAVGEVFAYRHDTHLTLSVVRRLHKSRDAQVKVGAERLGPNPVAVTLDSAGYLQPALYCAESPLGARLLVLPRAGGAEGTEYLLAAGGKRYRIRLGAPHEVLPDYVLAGFTVLERG
ncbi:hypothetical protein [Chitinimonas koreensis]|uniref:hypothetical protein n=1 Tax=Chitinimonas koreensis TaxID=356302 RepID=UPI0004211A1F|nr:hypothetical protein [Chitinimonas koreensis]